MQRVGMSRDSTCVPDFVTRLGADLTQIHGYGPYTLLRLVAGYGNDIRKWPSAKHSTSWLSLAPANEISGDRLLSSKTPRSSNRAAVLLRIAAVNIGRTQTALGAFYRRLAARTGKAKAVTATARKLAICSTMHCDSACPTKIPESPIMNSVIASECFITCSAGLKAWVSHW